VLQIIVWVIYVVTSMSIFLYLGRDRTPRIGKPVTPRSEPRTSEKTRHLPT
jgi:hypothetical protein